MTEYRKPGPYAEEVSNLEGPIKGAATGFGGMQAVTQKGPIGLVVRSRTFDAWKKVWGGRELRGDAAYEAETFFKEGGVELLTSRMCHFSDVDDSESYTGGVSNNTADTDGVAASAASKTTSIGPWVLEPGDSFTMDVDSGGAAASAFPAAPATLVDTATYPVSALAGGETMGVTVAGANGGSEQTVVAAGGETTEQDIIDLLNAQLTGVSVADDGAGQVEQTSDQKGTGASIQVTTPGTLNAILGFPTSAAGGSGRVADIAAVTAAELKIVVELATNADVVVNPDGSARIDSPTTGIGSELDFQSGDLAKFGLSVETLNGTDAGATLNTLKFYAGYHGYQSPGVNGDTIKRKITQNPKKVSLGVGGDLSVDAAALDTSLQVVTLNGITDQSVLKIWDGTNTEYFEVEAVRAEISGSTVTYYVDLVGALVNSYTAVAAQIQTQEFNVEIFEGNFSRETWVQVSMLDTSDNYVETLMNDSEVGSGFVVVEDLDADPPGLGADIPATDAAAVLLAGGSDETLNMVDSDWIGSSTGKTGIYAWDAINEFMSIAAIGNTNAAVVHQATQYARNRVWFDFIGYTPLGYTALQAKAYRETTLGLDSSYARLYGGGIKVYDPEGAGSNPRRHISGVMAVMGVQSRVDALPVPSGGPWQSPAGEGDYGTITSALDVGVPFSSADVGDLNTVHVNCIVKDGKTNPVEIWGARTLDASTAQKFRYINVRRFFNFAKKSVVANTRWATFRNNDFRLWDSLKDKINTWLRSLLPQRAFPSSEAAKAYFVKCGIPDGTMDQSDIDAGKTIGEIGLAPVKSTEFLIFRFSQYESGFDVEEL